MSPPWIADLQALYGETGNGLFVWEALADLPRDEALPDWVREYLAAAAVELLRPLTDPSVAPQDMRPLAAIFGLAKSGRNGNAWTERRQIARDAAVAFEYERRLAGRPGTSDSIISAAVKLLGVKRTALRDMIQRARARWEVQRRSGKRT